MTLIESEVPALLISADSTQIHGSSTLLQYVKQCGLCTASLTRIFYLLCLWQWCWSSIVPAHYPVFFPFNWNKLLQQSEHWPHLYPGKCNQTKPDFLRNGLSSSRASSAGVHGVSDRPISLNLRLMHPDTHCYCTVKTEKSTKVTCTDFTHTCVYLLLQNYEIRCPRGIHTVFWSWF